MHIPTIDLTREEAVLNYHPWRGNIANDPDDNPVTSAAVSSLSTHQQTICDESFLSTAPSHSGSGKATIVPSTSTTKNVLKQKFTLKMIDRVKALASKENKAQTLLQIGVNEATAHFDAITSQD